jgi:hypothetical protein
MRGLPARIACLRFSRWPISGRESGKYNRPIQGFERLSSRTTTLVRRALFRTLALG